MKYALLLFGLMLAGSGLAVSAQEAQLQTCLESCCTGSGGQWTSGGDCLGGNTNGYDQCSVGCIENAFGVSGGTSSCCGPTALLAGIAALAAFRR